MCGDAHADLIAIEPGVQYTVRFVHSTYSATIRCGSTLAAAVVALRSALGEDVPASKTIEERVAALENHIGYVLQWTRGR